MVGEGGLEFEKEMAKELGLKQVVGSGNKWYSRLDLRNEIARWSLKFTSKKSFEVNQKLIDEAVDACEGPGGDGTIPIWLFRLQKSKYDMVMMRKDDFLLMQEGNVNFTPTPASEKTKKKRAKALKPQLFREMNDD